MHTHLRAVEGLGSKVGKVCPAISVLIYTFYRIYSVMIRRSEVRKYQGDPPSHAPFKVSRGHSLASGHGNFLLSEFLFIVELSENNVGRLPNLPTFPDRHIRLQGLCGASNNSKNTVTYAESSAVYSLTGRSISLMVSLSFVSSWLARFVGNRSRSDRR